MDKPQAPKANKSNRPDSTKGSYSTKRLYSGVGSFVLSEYEKRKFEKAFKKHMAKLISQHFDINP